MLSTDNWAISILLLDSLPGIIIAGISCITAAADLVEDHLHSWLIADAVISSIINLCITGVILRVIKQDLSWLSVRMLIFSIATYISLQVCLNVWGSALFIYYQPTSQIAMVSIFVVVWRWVVLIVITLLSTTGSYRSSDYTPIPDYEEEYDQKGDDQKGDEQKRDEVR